MEAWFEICKYLRYRDVVTLTRTCKKMKVLNNDRVWKRLFEKTWWPSYGCDYPVPEAGQSWKGMLAARILHIRKILDNDPTINLILYQNNYENIRYHKIRLARKSILLTQQIAAHNHLTKPFSVTINLPGGRQEIFYSTALTRHTNPLYYRIGIEYAIHEFGEPNEEGVRSRIPYETLLTFSNVSEKDKFNSKQNRRELRETKRQKKFMGNHSSQTQ